MQCHANNQICLKFFNCETYYTLSLDNWKRIDFDEKRKAADGLISAIKATNDRVQIEWKI